MSMTDLIRAGLAASASLCLIVPAIAAPDTDHAADDVTVLWNDTRPARTHAPMPTTNDEAFGAIAKQPVGGPLAGLGPVPTAVTIPLAGDPDGDIPRGVAWTPDGLQLVVANRDTNNVMIHNAATGAVVATIDVGAGPNSVAVTADGTRAVVTCLFDNTVAIIDLGTNTLESTVPITGVEPFAVQTTADSTRAVVAVINDGVASQFSVIDLATQAETVIPVGGMGAIGFVFRVETGAFINLFMREMPRMASAVSIVAQLIASGIQIVIFLALPLWISWQTTLVSTVDRALLAMTTNGPTAGMPMCGFCSGV